MKETLSNIREHLQKEGFVYLCRWAYRRVRDKWYERRLGIDTHGFIQWDDLGEDPDSVDYEPIEYTYLNVILDRCNIQAEQDTFIDYGAGKGRPVIHAARRPFKKVIGVELSSDLCAVANQNVENAKSKLACQDVEIVNMDATRFQVPDDASVIFFYNPFTGHLLESVAERIRESLERAPRKLTIAYVYPHWKQSDFFADFDWLTKRDELPGDPLEKCKVSFYESVVDVFTSAREQQSAAATCTPLGGALPSGDIPVDPVPAEAATL